MHPAELRAAVCRPCRRANSLEFAAPPWPLVNHSPTKNRRAAVGKPCRPSIPLRSAVTSARVPYGRAACSQPAKRKTWRAIQFARTWQVLLDGPPVHVARPAPVAGLSEAVVLVQLRCESWL